MNVTVVSRPTLVTVDNTDSTVLVESRKTTVTVASQGVQGPPGPPGGEEQPFETDLALLYQIAKS